MTISFNPKPGTAPGDAVAEVDRVARATVPGSFIHPITIRSGGRRLGEGPLRVLLH